MNGISIQRTGISTLPSVFKARVDSSPSDEAFRVYHSALQTWQSINWRDAYKAMIGVRDAMLRENLQVGDRVLLALPNSPTWIYIEQAALYMGLVVVAVPTSHSANAISQVADEVDAKLIFIESDSIWLALQSNISKTSTNRSVVCCSEKNTASDIVYFDQWLNIDSSKPNNQPQPNISEDALATIIYTSGSCGTAQGVKHSHKNIINNAFASLDRIDVNAQDKMLSVTPLSHCMERVAGYYVAMLAGAVMVFPKSTESTLEDLEQSGATIIVTTPHHLNKAYKRLLDNLLVSAKLVDQYLDYLQYNDKWRVKFLFWPFVRSIIERKAKKLLLHQLRYVISGGSALSPKIISLSQLLNLPVLQGYGLTEAGGVVSANSESDNCAFSVGKSLNNVEYKLNEDNELYVRSNSLMLGYWGKDETGLTSDGWLATQDLVHSKDDYLFIDGRKNQTIHLSTGESVLPLPIEQRLIQDKLFDNVALFGENQEMLSLFCQINEDEWQRFLKKYAKRKELKTSEFTERLKSILLIRINALLQSVPGHPHIHIVFPTLDTWNIENGLLNAQGKVNKDTVKVYFAEDFAQLR